MELAPKILDVTLRWREVDSNFPFRAVNEHPSWSRLRSRATEPHTEARRLGRPRMDSPDVWAVSGAGTSDEGSRAGRAARRRDNAASPRLCLTTWRRGRGDGARLEPTRRPSPPPPFGFAEKSQATNRGFLMASGLGDDAQLSLRLGRAGSTSGWHRKRVASVSGAGTLALQAGRSASPWGSRYV